MAVMIKLILCLIWLASCAEQTVKHNERFYQERWCQARSGQLEVTVSEKGRKYRIDCVTRKYAIEFDFAGKWEALEQSLHYARLTGKRPGIVFICKSPKARGKILRTIKNIQFYRLPVKVWRENC